jgi:hypothetical protein
MFLPLSLSLPFFFFLHPSPKYSIYSDTAMEDLYQRITNISRPYDKSGLVTALHLVVNTSAIDRALEQMEAMTE